MLGGGGEICAPLWLRGLIALRHYGICFISTVLLNQSSIHVLETSLMSSMASSSLEALGCLVCSRTSTPACEIRATCFAGDFDPWLSKCFAHGNSLPACEYSPCHCSLHQGAVRHYVVIRSYIAITVLSPIQFRHGHTNGTSFPCHPLFCMTNTLMCLIRQTLHRVKSPLPRPSTPS